LPDAKEVDAGAAQIIEQNQRFTRDQKIPQLLKVLGK